MTRPRVFLDVNIGQDPAGRLVIELFHDKTPKTCENFRQLCTGEHDGLSYAKTPFHRVIDQFMVQAGDVQNGDGTGAISIYGREFEDENLHWREMDAAGLVCSANRGKDTNGSQFFVTLEPCPHLDGKHCIFGRLLSGHETLERIAKVAVDDNDCPLEPVLVSRCGELERREKKQDRPQEKTAAAHVGARGRRRKSDQDVSEEMEENGSLQGRQGRIRRQSDNVVDEGIRGRPRLRSVSRSSSHPPEEADAAASDHSPTRLHKRKRSPSPSRHINYRSDNFGYDRRRRSLPNQHHHNGGERHPNHDEGYRPSPRRGDSRHTDRPRAEDRYRPLRDRHAVDGVGRLGGRDGYDDYDPPVKFKGRGTMKYRESERVW